MDYKLFVIIVTYNGSNWIEKCLNSVFKSTIVATPIVIDNCSTDNTVSIIKEKYPQCILVESKDNLGFGRANNRGIKLAIDKGADYVYLLNQDAWVEPDVFAILVSTHKRNPIYGIISPIQFTGDGSVLDPGFKDNAVSTSRCPGFLGDFSKSQMKEIYPTFFVMAAHWLLYVPDLKRIGFFSPAFPHYGEDTNLTQRYHYHGMKIGISGNAKAYHDRQYREITPAKQLYMNYIVYITIMNDLESDTLYLRTREKVRLIWRCFVRLRGVSFSEKLKYVIRAYKEGLSSSKYKTEYKKEFSKLYDNYC